MYYKHPEGTSYRVYEIDVHIPPEGYVWDYIEGEWTHVGVYRRSNKVSEQYWERPQPDFDYKKERAKERARQGKSDYVDPRLESFRTQEWFRRLNGFWFMNNGVPTYITGQHYFYLTWWRIDVGYPRFVVTDMETFYLWKWVEDNPNCFGLIEATKRRSGKTWRSNCLLYERITRMGDAEGGIQSKTDDDAKKVYIKMLKAYKYLPDFFIPELSSSPLSPTGLQFGINPGKKTVASLEELQEGLDSSIGFESSKDEAYDGSKLQHYLRDEYGKSSNADVYNTWEVVRFCLLDDNMKLAGKAHFTSTIEEKASASAKLLWDESDPNNLNSEKQTLSGMVRLFTPSYRSTNTNKYGYADEEAEKERQLRVRESYRGNPKKLAGYIRKTPFDIKEAFYTINDEAIFDSLKINQQLEVLSYKEESEWVKRGNFQWRDGISDSSVIFVENSQGKFYLHHAIDPEDSRWNAVKEVGWKKFPLNETSIVLGSDPYDHKTRDVADQLRASKGTGYAFHKYSSLDDELSETFLCQYIARPDDPDVFYEDMLMMCFFFGGKMAAERNKSGLINHFDRRGYGHWLVKDSKGSRGIPATTPSKQELAEVTENLITHNCHKVVFKELLHDWNVFSLENSTKNDMTMGAGWALVAAYRIDRKLVDTKKKQIKKESIFNKQPQAKRSFLRHL